MPFRCTGRAARPSAAPAVVARPSRCEVARSSWTTSPRQVCLLATKGTVNGSVPELATVTFEVQRHVDFGDRLCVVGDAEALGKWDPDNCVPMEWTEGDAWIAKVELPAKETIEYKYIVKHDDVEDVEWQPGKNAVHKVGVVGTDGKVINEWQPFEETGEEVGAEEAAARSIGVGPAQEEIVEEAKTGAVTADSQEDAVAEEKTVAEKKTKSLGTSTAATSDARISGRKKASKKPADKLAPKAADSTMNTVT